MTYKDLLLVVIRLYALLSFSYTLLALLTTALMNLYFSTDELSFSNGLGMFPTQKYPLLMMVPNAISAVFYALILYKAEAVVRLLCLDKGYSGGEIDFGSVTTIEVAKICVFILCAYPLVTYFPELVQQSFWLFKASVSGRYNEYGDTITWAYCALHVVMSALLITKFSTIARFVDRKFGKKPIEATPATSEDVVD